MNNHLKCIVCVVHFENVVTFNYKSQHVSDNRKISLVYSLFHELYYYFMDIDFKNINSLQLGKMLSCYFRHIFHYPV